MRTLGAELSVELFAAAGWSALEPLPNDNAPYPGLRPTGSWSLNPDGALRGLEATADGWRDRGTERPIALANRSLVLAYGSNPDPVKLLEQDDFFGGQPVFALRAAVFGWAAVWCAARRADGSVVATLAPVKGRVEVHPVFALTPHQIHAMDRWEGHPRWYRRQRHEGTVLLESGHPAERAEVYLGTPERRPALRISGAPALCAEVPYAEVNERVAP
jgi:hypothetical protein